MTIGGRALRYVDVVRTDAKIETWIPFALLYLVASVRIGYYEIIRDGESIAATLISCLVKEIRPLGRGQAAQLPGELANDCAMRLGRLSALLAWWCPANGHPDPSLRTWHSLA